MISLATATVNNKVRRNVNAALDEGMLGGGRFIKSFEEKAKKYFNVKHAIAVCNGTMADTVSIAALRQLRPEKTEVILPALTFVAQSNSVLINGLKPVFVDVGPTFQANIDEIESKITNKTLAIFGVHLLGKDCGIKKLVKIAKKHKVFLVEDCCEAFGGEVSGKKFGTFGQYGTFSFFPSHTITTGEGGMIITNDNVLAGLARKVMNHGRRSDHILEKFHFDAYGFNGKMSNVLAAIGDAVINLAPGVIKKRQKNVAYMNKRLEQNWFAESPHCYPVLFSSQKERDDMLQKLIDNGIEARKLFSSLPTQERVYSFLKHKKGEFAFAEYVGERGLFLPVHQNLSNIDLSHIIDVLDYELVG